MDIHVIVRDHAIINFQSCFPHGLIHVFNYAYVFCKTEKATSIYWGEFAQTPIEPTSIFIIRGALKAFKTLL